MGGDGRQEDETCGIDRGADDSLHELKPRVPARHARPCAGHPRLHGMLQIKTWLAGSSPAMTISKPVRDLAFAISKQRREAPLAVAAEIDHATAGGGIAGGPFQLGEPRHEGSTQGAGEMMPPLAPVETGLAYRAARMGERVRIDLQRFGHETLAFGSQFDRLLA